MTVFDQKYIENPMFLKWIFNTDTEVNSYWEQYLAENPEEKNQILELRKHLVKLRYANEKLSVFEKRDMERRIMKNFTGDNKGNRLRLMLQSFMKYAAVAIIFMSIGGLLVYLNTPKDLFNQQQFSQAVHIPDGGQGPLLITSNGKNVDLKKSNSTVDYSQSGSVVLNNDTIIQTSVEETDVLNQLVIPYGNQSRVVLSDNTVVWLNSGSQLIYPTVFKDKTREVLLFGEAYFEVAKNPDHPFVVKTSEIDVKVLGTKFNVSAYAEDNVIQTVLKEGSVAIRRKGAGFFEKDILIKPDQLASFDKLTSDTKIYEVDAEYHTLWIKGLISFEDIDFNRVIKKVERFYNVKINFSDPQKQVIRISGKLDLKQSRKEVFEYLEKVSSSEFEQYEENQFIIK